MLVLNLNMSTIRKLSSIVKKKRNLNSIICIQKLAFITKLLLNNYYKSKTNFTVFKTFKLEN